MKRERIGKNKIKIENITNTDKYIIKSKHQPVYVSINKQWKNTYIEKAAWSNKFNIT